MTNCVHNVIRRKRPETEGEQSVLNLYVCGTCAALFEVKEYVEPESPREEPMFDRRPPWGTRSRQA